jgi:hypothetical protein
LKRTHILFPEFFAENVFFICVPEELAEMLFVDILTFVLEAGL